VVEQPFLVAENLKFPEGPRWHDGELWFSDIHAHHVLAMDRNGERRIVLELPTRPSGLGFWPDGTLLVVGMRRPRALYAFGKNRVSVLADLDSLPGDFINDIVVDGRGRAYAGFRSDRRQAGAEAGPEGIVLVEPDGSFRIVAEGLKGPNGSVVSPDGRTLIVAETHGHLLTAFDIEADGSLTNRRTFAETSDAFPDGICLDAEGAIWIGGGREFRRVLEGGQVAATVAPSAEGWSATACALGGEDRRTLFMLEHWPEPRLGAMLDPAADVSSPLRGRIDAVQVDVPGAGWP
jgi:sugar lactone lactonase YvrE